MARRLGLKAIRNAAEKICKLYPLYNLVIKKFYPESTTLHTALDALNIACANLVEEAEAVIEVGD